MTGAARFSPNSKQRRVCDSDALTVLVTGGAGTGKTATAAAAARAHLLRKRVDASPVRDRVLFLTFSRTAVSQILNRSIGILGDVAGQVDVFTFHGLAWQLVCDFGRYIGHGVRPLLRSEAESKLFREDPQFLSYDDLLPEALRILSLPLIGRLAQSRWSLVICDEFQDTDNEQWRLLELLTAPGNRLLLLCDPNQMIYDGFLGMRGVGPRRLAVARKRLGIEEIPLPAGSYRDPTQLLPTVAEAVRIRNFSHPSIAEAIDEGRLRIVKTVEDAPSVEVVCDAVDESRKRGARSFGLFVHGNEPTASMSAALTQKSVNHVVMGLSESYGEALIALIAMLEFALGRVDWSDVLIRMAVFYTSTVRSKQAPPLAMQIANGRSTGLLGRRLDELRDELSQVSELSEAAKIAGSSWAKLALGRGHRPWRRAAAEIRRYEALARSESPIEEIRRRAEEMRASSFTEIDYSDRSTVQLMNLHQTKGREADAIIAMFRSNDYFGPEAEPFERASRLLYVVLTRARRQVTIILPKRPHPLVAPFANLVAE